MLHDLTAFLSFMSAESPFQANYWSAGPGRNEWNLIIVFKNDATRAWTTEAGSMNYLNRSVP